MNVAYTYAKDLAFDPHLWQVSRALSAVIYLTIAVAALFICYMIFQRRPPRR